MARKTSIKHPTLLQKAQAEIKRLTAFQHWFRLHARHTEWCPANKSEMKDCTCGFSHLFNQLK